MLDIFKYPKELQTNIKSKINQELQSKMHCHCPLLGADEKGKPYLIGTGIVLDIDDNIFIATAAHVIDERKTTSIYTFLDDKDKEIVSIFHSTIKPDDDRSKDKIDISICKVEDSLVSKFRSNYKGLF